MLKMQKIMTGIMMVMMILGSLSMVVKPADAQAAGQLTPSDLGVDQQKATGLPDKDVREVIAYIIRVILGLLGTVCVVIILYAGFLWMTSGGESDKAEQARTMITNAIIGLVIIVAAFAISSFVLSSLVNVSR
jgi:hypothetical protein